VTVSIGRTDHDAVDTVVVTCSWTPTAHPDSRVRAYTRVSCRWLFAREHHVEEQEFFHLRRGLDGPTSSDEGTAWRSWSLAFGTPLPLDLAPACEPPTAIQRVVARNLC